MPCFLSYIFIILFFIIYLILLAAQLPWVLLRFLNSILRQPKEPSPHKAEEEMAAYGKQKILTFMNSGSTIWNEVIVVTANVKLDTEDYIGGKGICNLLNIPVLLTRR